MEVSALEVEAPVLLRVEEGSQSADARRQAEAIAERLGFSETDRGRIAIIASELAGNLVRHTVGGEIHIRPVSNEGIPGIEILALDSGPGMVMGEAMRDGFSTHGGAGEGLGAVRRLADEFDAYSLPGSGTALLARRWSRPRPRRPDRVGIDIGGLAVPKPRESRCGDAWSVIHSSHSSLVVLADGLGHGPLAAEAASLAMKVFQECGELDVEEVLHRIHGGLKRTRGAAVGVARLDRRAGTVTFAGVGNVSGRVFSGVESHHLVTQNGTAGRTAGVIRSLTHPWPAGALVVVHSDGVAGHWRLDQYPGLAPHDPTLVAAVLYRHHRRGDDDASVVVARAGPSTT